MPKSPWIEAYAWLVYLKDDSFLVESETDITPARKFRMLLHINPTRQRGKRTGSLAGASGWYMTFFAAGVITGRAGPTPP